MDITLLLYLEGYYKSNSFKVCREHLSQREGAIGVQMKLTLQWMVVKGTLSAVSRAGIRVRPSSGRRTEK